MGAAAGPLPAADPRAAPRLDSDLSGLPGDLHRRHGFLLADEGSRMCSAPSPLLLAFLSASQDIVIDAYRVDAIPPSERALAAAAAAFGYRTAAMLAGAVLVYRCRRSRAGSLAFLFVACLMAATMVATIWAPEPECAGTRRRAAWPRRSGIRCARFLTQKGMWGFLAAGAALQGGRRAGAQLVQHLHDSRGRLFAG